MKVFDDFLKLVLEENPDEFPELNDIVSRYKTLKHSNDMLKAGQNQAEKEIEDLSETNMKYKKEQTNKMVKQGGNIATKQQMLEQYEAQKEKIISFNEENSSKRMATTCEHGQILMTIDNLYAKVTKNKNCHELNKINNPQDMLQKNFDKIDESEATTLKQLDHIKNFVVLFDIVKKELKIKRKEIEAKAAQNTSQNLVAPASADQ